MQVKVYAVRKSVGQNGGTEIVLTLGSRYLSAGFIITLDLDSEPDAVNPRQRIVKLMLICWDSRSRS
jgi:hypothetical protein